MLIKYFYEPYNQIEINNPKIIILNEDLIFPFSRNFLIEILNKENFNISLIEKLSYFDHILKGWLEISDKKSFTLNNFKNNSEYLEFYLSIQIKSLENNSLEIKLIQTQNVKNSEFMQILSTFDYRLNNLENELKNIFYYFQDFLNHMNNPNNAIINNEENNNYNKSLNNPQQNTYNSNDDKNNSISMNNNSSQNNKGIEENLNESNEDSNNSFTSLPKYKSRYSKNINPKFKSKKYIKNHNKSLNKLKKYKYIKILKQKNSLINTKQNFDYINNPNFNRINTTTKNYQINPSSHCNNNSSTNEIIFPIDQENYNDNYLDTIQNRYMRSNSNYDNHKLIYDPSNRDFTTNLNLSRKIPSSFIPNLSSRKYFYNNLQNQYSVISNGDLNLLSPNQKSNLINNNIKRNSGIFTDETNNLLLNSLEESRLDFSFMYSHPIVKEVNSKIKACNEDPIDYESEINYLHNIFYESNKNIKVRFEVATMKNLSDIIRKKPKILHISCHGAYKEYKDESRFFLYFEESDGKLEEMDVQKLSRLLKSSAEEKSQIDLVFVSACHSEAVADVFTQAKVPAVICVHSQTKVLDKAAQEFATEFYKSLMDGKDIKFSFDHAQNYIFAHLDRRKITEMSCCCFHNHKPECKWKIESMKNGEQAHLSHLKGCACNYAQSHEHAMNCSWADVFLRNFENFSASDNFENFLISHTKKVCCCSPELAHDESNKFILRVNNKEIEKKIFFDHLHKGNLEIKNANNILNLKNISINIFTSLIGRNLDLYNVIQFYCSDLMKKNRMVCVYGNEGVGKNSFIQMVGKYMFERNFFQDLIYIDSRGVRIDRKFILSRILQYLQYEDCVYEVNFLAKNFEKEPNKKIMIIINIIHQTTESIEEIKNFIFEFLEKTRNVKFLVSNLSALNIDGLANNYELKPLDKKTAAILLMKLASDQIKKEFRITDIKKLAEHDIITYSECNPSVIYRIANMLKEKQSAHYLMETLKDNHRKKNTHHNDIIRFLTDFNENKDLTSLILYIFLLLPYGILKMELIKIFLDKYKEVDNIINNFLNYTIIDKKSYKADFKDDCLFLKQDIIKTIDGIKIDDNIKQEAYKKLILYYASLTRNIVISIYNNIILLSTNKEPSFEFSAAQNYGIWYSLPQLKKCLHRNLSCLSSDSCNNLNLQPSKSMPQASYKMSPDFKNGKENPNEENLERNYIHLNLNRQVVSGFSTNFTTEENSNDFSGKNLINLKSFEINSKKTKDCIDKCEKIEDLNVNRDNLEDCIYEKNNFVLKEKKSDEFLNRNISANYINNINDMSNKINKNYMNDILTNEEDTKMSNIPHVNSCNIKNDKNKEFSFNLNKENKKILNINEKDNNENLTNENNYFSSNIFDNNLNKNSNINHIYLDITSENYFHKKEEIKNPEKTYDELVETNINYLIKSDVPLLKYFIEINDIEFIDALEHILICIPTILKLRKKYSDCINYFKDYSALCEKFHLHLAKARLSLMRIGLDSYNKTDYAKNNIRDLENSPSLSEINHIIDFFNKNKYNEGKAESLFLKFFLIYENIHKFKNRTNLQNQETENLIFKKTQEAIKIFNECNNEYGKARVQYFLGELCVVHQKKFDEESLNFLKESLKVFKPNKNKKENEIMTIYILLAISKWYLGKNSISESKKYALEAKNSAQTINNYFIVSEAYQVFDNVIEKIRSCSQNAFIFIKSHQLTKKIEDKNLENLTEKVKKYFKFFPDFFSNINDCITITSKDLYKNNILLSEIPNVDLSNYSREIKEINIPLLPIISHFSKFKDNLLNRFKKINKEVHVKFEYLNKNNFKEILESIGKVLHISADDYDKEGSLYLEGQNGESIKLSEKELSKLLESTKTNSCSFNYELVILAIPQSKNLANLFIEHGASHVICFEFDEDFLDIVNNLPDKTIFSCLHDFSVNIIFKIINQKTIQEAFKESVQLLYEEINNIVDSIQKFFIKNNINENYETYKKNPSKENLFRLCQVHLLPFINNHEKKLFGSFNSGITSLKKGLYLDLSKMRARLYNINKRDFSLVSRKKDLYETIKIITNLENLNSDYKIENIEENENGCENILENKNSEKKIMEKSEKIIHIINIYAESGTGKSVFVKEIGYYFFMRNFFNGGIFYFDLMEIKSLDKLKSLFMKSSVFPKEKHNQNIIFEEYPSHTKKILIILDNTDKIIKNSENNFFDYLKTSNNKKFHVLYILVMNKKINTQIDKVEIHNILLEKLNKIESAYLFLNYCQRNIDIKELLEEINDENFQLTKKPEKFEVIPDNIHILEILKNCKRLEICMGLPKNIKQLAELANDTNISKVNPKDFAPKNYFKKKEIKTFENNNKKLISSGGLEHDKIIKDKTIENLFQRTAIDNDLKSFTMKTKDNKNINISNITEFQKEFYNENFANRNTGNINDNNGEYFNDNENMDLFKTYSSNDLVVNKNNFKFNVLNNNFLNNNGGVNESTILNNKNKLNNTFKTLNSTKVIKFSNNNIYIGDQNKNDNNKNKNNLKKKISNNKLIKKKEKEKEKITTYKKTKNKNETNITNPINKKNNINIKDNNINKSNINNDLVNIQNPKNKNSKINFRIENSNENSSVEKSENESNEIILETTFPAKQDLKKTFKVRNTIAIFENSNKNNFHREINNLINIDNNHNTMLPFKLAEKNLIKNNEEAVLHEENLQKCIMISNLNNENYSEESDDSEKSILEDEKYIRKLVSKNLQYEDFNSTSNQDTKNLNKISDKNYENDSYINYNSKIFSKTQVDKLNTNNYICDEEEKLNVKSENKVMDLKDFDRKNNFKYSSDLINFDNNRKFIIQNNTNILNNNSEKNNSKDLRDKNISNNNSNKNLNFFNRQTYQRLENNINNNSKQDKRFSININNSPFSNNLINNLRNNFKNPNFKNIQNNINDNFKNFSENSSNKNNQVENLNYNNSQNSCNSSNFSFNYKNSNFNNTNDENLIKGPFINKKINLDNKNCELNYEENFNDINCLSENIKIITPKKIYGLNFSKEKKMLDKNQTFPDKINFEIDKNPKIQNDVDETSQMIILNETNSRKKYKLNSSRITQIIENSNSIINTEIISNNSSKFTQKISSENKTFLNNNKNNIYITPNSDNNNKINLNQENKYFNSNKINNNLNLHQEKLINFPITNKNDRRYSQINENKKLATNKDLKYSNIHKTEKDFSENSSESENDEREDPYIYNQIRFARSVNYDLTQNGLQEISHSQDNTIFSQHEKNINFKNLLHDESKIININYENIYSNKDSLIKENFFNTNNNNSMNTINIDKIYSNSMRIDTMNNIEGNNITNNHVNNRRKTSIMSNNFYENLKEFLGQEEYGFNNYNNINENFMITNKKISIGKNNVDKNINNINSNNKIFHIFEKNPNLLNSNNNSMSNPSDNCNNSLMKNNNNLHDYSNTSRDNYNNLNQNNNNLIRFSNKSDFSKNENEKINNYIFGDDIEVIDDLSVKFKLNNNSKNNTLINEEENDDQEYTENSDDENDICESVKSRNNKTTSSVENNLKISKKKGMKSGKMKSKYGKKKKDKFHTHIKN